MIVHSLFKPAWWLKNPHMQTIYTSIMRWIKSPSLRMERFELPDGDFIDLAWADRGLSVDAPLVILLHGLGGSMHSSYIASQIRVNKQMGWRSVVMHFRGASGVPNRLLRAYHSGDTADLDVVLRALAQREPDTRKYVVGFSVGGNVLLKWLGEKGPQSLVSAAVAVSVPFQLSVAADRLNEGFSRVYQWHLLRRLRQIFLRKLVHPSHATLLHRLKSAKCFWTFDDQITAPLHGFDNVHAYYRESSSKSYLSSIDTQTLVIHALDDPFMKSEAIPLEDELSSKVTLELSPKGGHVGFIEGNMPGWPRYWLDKRILAFFLSVDES